MHSNASCRFNPRPATLQKSHIFSLLHEAHQASARFLPQGPYVFFLLLAGAHQNRCKHAPRLEPGPPSATAFFTPTTAQAVFSLCMLSHAPLAPAPVSLRFWIATGTLLPTATLPRTSLHSHTWPRHRGCISPANEQSPRANSGYSAFPSRQPNNLFLLLCFPYTMVCLVDQRAKPTTSKFSPYRLSSLHGRMCCSQLSLATNLHGPMHLQKPTSPLVTRKRCTAPLAIPLAQPTAASFPRTPQAADLCTSSTPRLHEATNLVPSS